jgi:prepilin peptidase CpaA
MTPYVNLANAVLAVTAGVLLHVAIAALFLAYTGITGRWDALFWNLAIAGLVFVVLLYFYSRSWMGGGDVKMLSVAFLWIGSDCALLFAVLLCLFASIHGLAAKLKWVRVQHAANDERARIAFAPSVAAALIGTFLLGCLQRA